LGQVSNTSVSLANSGSFGNANRHTWLAEKGRMPLVDYAGNFHIVRC